MHAAAPQLLAPRSPPRAPPRAPQLRSGAQDAQDAQGAAGLGHEENLN